MEIKIFKSKMLSITYLFKIQILDHILMKKASINKLIFPKTQDKQDKFKIRTKIYPKGQKL